MSWRRIWLRYGWSRPARRGKRSWHAGGSGSRRVGKDQGHVSIRADTPAIYPAWETLIRRHQVMGKPSHDARLVAAMQVHGITAVLRFDKARFSRFPDIEVVHPANVGTTTDEG